MRTHGLKLLAIILSLHVATACADDFRVSSSNRIDSMLQQQEQEIGQLRAEMASLRRELSDAVRAPEGGAIGYNQPTVSGCGNGCCGASCCNTTDCCTRGCNDSCCDPLAYQSGFGWFGYGEAFIVKPYSTFGTAAQGDFNLTPTPRITLGHVGASGFGVRVRYWTFNDFANTNDPFSLLNVFKNQIQTHVADIEATDRIQLGRWILTGSLGLRYVSFLDRFTDPTGAFVAPGLLYFREKTESLGIVGGLNVVRPFAYRWSFYGNARYSILTGKTSYSASNGVLPTGFSFHSTTQSIAELGAGIQYNRRLWNGMNLVGRGGYEAQYWNGFGDILLGGQSTTFAGLTFGAGLNY